MTVRLTPDPTSGYGSADGLVLHIPCRRAEPRLAEPPLRLGERLASVFDRDQLARRILHQLERRRHPCPAALEDDRHRLTGFALPNDAVHIVDARVGIPRNRHDDVLALEASGVRGR